MARGLSSSTGGTAKNSKLSERSEQSTNAREPLDEFSYRIHYDDHKRWDCRVHFLGNSVITEYYYNDRLVKGETT